MPYIEHTEPEKIYNKYVRSIRISLAKKWAYFNVYNQDVAGGSKKSVRLKDLLLDPNIDTSDKQSFIKVLRYILSYGLEVEIDKIPTNIFDSDDPDP